MKNLKKIIVVSILLAVGAVFLMTSPTKSVLKQYYSGDTINYQGTAYIGTTNTGRFELFALDKGVIYKKAVIASNDRESQAFVDLKFSNESGRLYVYLINGRYLYKYDISDPIIPEMITKIKDNSWDWFYYVDIVNGNLVTTGSKGVKIWNKDLQVIDSYSMINKDNIGMTVAFSNGGEYIINTRGKIDVFSTATRDKVSEFKIASTDDHKREVINDDQKGLFYVVDDESLKAISFDGRIVKEFRHVSTAGYDVAGSNNDAYLYFSDGLGVVKIRKSDFKPIDWEYTTNLSSVPGSWAMGINPLSVNGKEYLVVFNGSNILLLDENLEKVDDYGSVEEYVGPIEALSLTLDKNRTSVGSQISVRAKGFWPNEPIQITIGKKTVVYNTKTDGYGRVTAILDVPSSAKVEKSYVKATGKDSKLTYSTSLDIE